MRLSRLCLAAAAASLGTSRAFLTSLSMCRIAVYKGPEVPLSELLLKPTNSLVRQSARTSPPECVIPGLPQSLAMPRNVDGTGLAWYDQQGNAHRHRVPVAAGDDAGLRRLASEVCSGLVFGHVRSAAAGVTGESAAAVAETNCHPFTHGNLCFMHNGAISGFSQVRHLLEAHCSSEAAAVVQGTTDSELCFALFLTQLGDSRASHSALHLAHALDKTIGIITATTAAAGIANASSLNMAVTNGEHVVVSRYRNSRDPAQQPPSLYLNYGADLRVGADSCLRFSRPHEMSGVVISSEPLCGRALDCWAIVPKNHMVVAVADAYDPTKVGRLWLRPVLFGVDVEDRDTLTAAAQQQTAAAAAAAAAAARGGAALNSAMEFWGAGARARALRGAAAWGSASDLLSTELLSDATLMQRGCVACV